MLSSDRMATNEQSNTKGGGGCWQYLLIPLFGFWIGGVITICQTATWILEQDYFSSFVPATDPRWMIGLVGGVAIWLPSILLSRSARMDQRAIFNPGRWLAF